MIIRFFLKNPTLAALFHIMLGAVAKYIPIVSTAYFILFALIGLIDIWNTKDKNSIAAFYAMYLTSFEIVYRVGKFYIFWELGKYLCIIILIVGLLQSRKHSARITPFALYLLLMLPGIPIALYFGAENQEYLRQLILQNVSGPICLGISGWYFYKRVVSITQLYQILRLAILPSISLVVLLFLGKSISEISFATSSNFEASGGFGPNQVSTMLGWGIAIIGFALFKRVSVTINQTTDIILLCLLAFRGLLTFSRGGMAGAILGISLMLFVPLLFSPKGLQKAGRVLVQFTFLCIIFIFVAFLVNIATNNFLYYRYYGGTPVELEYAAYIGNSGYNFSGREVVAQYEWEAFQEMPLFGTGAGRGTLYRIDRYEFSTASHLEFTRMIGEHGVLGLLALLVMIYLPIQYFFQYPFLSTRQWMILMYILSTFTMFHSSIRLAMPSVAFGLAFILIADHRRVEKHSLHR